MRPRLLTNLCLNDDKVWKHVNQKSKIHGRTSVKQNVETQFLDFFPEKRKTIFSQLNFLTSGFLNPWLLKRKNVLMLVKIKKKLSISTRQLLLLELSDVQLSFICSGNCHCLNLQTKSIINSYKLILLPTWDLYRSVQHTDQSGFPQMCQKWSASQSAPENDSFRH